MLFIRKPFCHYLHLIPLRFCLLTYFVKWKSKPGLYTRVIAIGHQCSKQVILQTRSHPEMVGDMSRVTLNFDLSKIRFVRF